LIRFTGDHGFALSLGVGVNSINVEEIIEDGQVLLINLSREGKQLSKKQQRMIGALMVNEIYEHGMSRRTGARPAYVYIDEAGMFVTPELGDSLDHLRQKGVHFTFGFQHLQQFKSEDLAVYESVMNSTGNKIVFSIRKRADALELADSIFYGLSEP